jgi:hypothetical protein
LGGFAQKVGSTATKIKTEKMWAIWNNEFGFYTGTWLTREEAIHYHVSQKEPSKDWGFCKKRGDHCIRVEISAAQPRARLTNGGRAKIEGGSKAAIRN